MADAPAQRPRFPHDHHQDAPRPSWLARIRTVLHVRIHRISTVIVVASGSMLGADTLGLLVSFWPLYPNLVPAILVLGAVGYALAWLFGRGRAGRTDSGLTFRPPRRGPHRLPLR